EATLQINQMVWRVFDRDGNYQTTRSMLADNALTIAHPFTFRDMRGVTLKIETQIETDTEILTLDVLDFNLLGANPVSIPTELSSAFIDAYKALADNWDNSYLRQLPLGRPKMLIISHSQLGPYQTEYIKWKRSLGMDVYVINKSEAGNSLQEIRNTIQNHYQQYRCDYLFLWGDTVGTYTIPTNFYPSPEYVENDADDQYYALLEGDDYFPEMLVGRFSFNAVSEFLVMASKTIKYEREPFMEDSSWMTRGLVVAGNYAEGGLRPITPVQMSRWLRDKMLTKGYAQVDSVFYPDAYPATSLITSAINQGAQIISYRGWGDANGWHYPSFHIPDLDATYNGAKMPIVFSIVCNTGDFANSVNPSFGERWMRMGTTANLGGCVAFVGPSDLHTKTRLNNSISSGAFRSILDYGVRGFGSSVLMGKIELYKNFPNDIAPGQYVPFYFHVYNLLSDPSLNMWILQPDTIPESIIEGGLTFSQTASYIRINAPNLNGAMVSGTKDDISYAYAVVNNGYAILPVDPNLDGDLRITVSKPNYLPLVRTLTVDRDGQIG
ncbi:MAG TPA: C25 family cysteine peptidase, partial [Candidatus Cloacimonadota bacterium]|nr:C25 family cysteine peptidase [Candidatus Cloacimonadota bacterium]